MERLIEKLFVGQELGRPWLLQWGFDFFFFYIFFWWPHWGLHREIKVQISPQETQQRISPIVKINTRISFLGIHMLREKLQATPPTTWRRVLVWASVIYALWVIVDLVLLVIDKYPQAYSRHHRNVQSAALDFETACRGQLLHHSRSAEMAQFCESRHAQSQRSPASLSFAELRRDWVSSWRLSADWGCGAGSACHQAVFNFADKLSDSLWIILPCACLALVFCAQASLQFISFFSLMRHQQMYKKEHASPRSFTTLPEPSPRRRYFVEYPQSTALPITSSEVVEEEWAPSRVVVHKD